MPVYNKKNISKIKFSSVVVAAGYSKRAGLFKPALEINGIPMLIRCIQPMLSICSNIYIVTGYKKENIKSIITEFTNELPIEEKYLANNIKLVYNKNFSNGMFSSVQKGFSKVLHDNTNNEDKHYIFFTPADYAFVEKSTFISMINYIKQNNSDLLIPTMNNRKGHPILINSKFALDISNSKLSSLRTFLKNYFTNDTTQNTLTKTNRSNNSTKIKNYLEINDKGILFDIDTKEDILKTKS